MKVKSLSFQKLSIPEKAKIAIVYRLATPAAVKLAKDLASSLKKKNYKVFTAFEQKLIPGTELVKTKKGMNKINLVIVLGGDGTYLRAVRMIDGEQIPTLGINLGSLGFLTTTIAEEALQAVEKTLNGEMYLQPRAMLEVKVYRKNKLRGELVCLNDIVLERGQRSQLINVSLSTEKNFVNEIKADGLIISSPTGSTAYNLAAGGPIMHPEVKAFVVTAIAPHSLTSRPLIFPDHRSLYLKLINKKQKLSPSTKSEARLVIDGQMFDKIGLDDEIRIKRYTHDHLMIRDPNLNFFSLLREKMKFGDRP